MESLVCALLVREFGTALLPQDRAAVRQALDNHGLLHESSSVLRSLLRRILSADYSTDLEPISCTYPDGTGGLTNLFLDLQAHFPALDWDDYGEGIRGVFPRCDAQLFVSREGGDFTCVRPASEPLDGWLREARRRLRSR